MRIATSQMFDRPLSRMSQLGARADAAQTQIATGNKLAAPSSDPAAYLRLQTIRRASADDAAYGANIATAQTILAEGDTALDSVESQLQRAQELATQAATGTLSDANRAAIGKELASIRDSLLALANSRDVRGQPLFGGATGDAAFVEAADGTVSYAGTGEPAAIPIGENSSVQASVTGDRVFASTGGDVFALLDQFTTALSVGGEANGPANSALTGLKATLENVALARTSLGARAARLEVETERLAQVGDAREAARSALEDTDVAAAVTELQKTLTILQATQASFTKLSGLSLFDYLR
jgi:flagellar hook-associated protein 3 FlgL